MAGRHEPAPAPTEWHGDAQEQYEADIAAGVWWETAWDWAAAEHARLEIVASNAFGACVAAGDCDFPAFDGDGNL